MVYVVKLSVDHAQSASGLGCFQPFVLEQALPTELLGFWLPMLMLGLPSLTMDHSLSRWRSTGQWPHLAGQLSWMLVQLIYPKALVLKSMVTIPVPLQLIPSHSHLHKCSCSQALAPIQSCHVYSIIGTTHQSTYSPSNVFTLLMAEKLWLSHQGSYAHVFRHWSGHVLSLGLVLIMPSHLMSSMWWLPVFQTLVWPLCQSQPFCVQYYLRLPRMHFPSLMHHHLSEWTPSHVISNCPTQPTYRCTLQQCHSITFPWNFSNHCSCSPPN